jgi:hypothetical protein
MQITKGQKKEFPPKQCKMGCSEGLFLNICSFGRKQNVLEEKDKATDDNILGHLVPGSSATQGNHRPSLSKKPGSGDKQGCV